MTGKWILIILIFLFTFPAFIPEYGIGLDASYIWGLNWLFAHDYSTLKQLVYPFGPLAFLKIPSPEGHNLLFALTFFSVLKLVFIRLMFKMAEVSGKKYNLSSFLLILIASYFTTTDFLIIGMVLMLNWLYYKENHWLLFGLSVFLAFTGLFIKISIGITSFSIVAVSMILHFVEQKKIKDLGIQSGITVVLGLIMGLAVFGNLGIYFRFLTGSMMLSGGYGDTLSLFPDNRWILLIPFIILMIVTPFITKEKNIRILFLLAFFPLLALWKHSFIREDIYHYTILLSFLFIFWSIVLIISNSGKYLLLGIAFTTIMLLYANMRVIPMYRGIKTEVVGINNFIDAIQYKSLKQKYRNISEENVSPHRLDDEVRNLIGEGTIDIYPWEFSYAAANGLNWKPRKTLELGASTSRWASEKASEHYLLHDDAPRSILFQFHPDPYGGKLGSIDNRYILNDEPLVIYNILNNYKVEKQTDNFCIFRKNDHPRIVETLNGEKQSIVFDKWIEIPRSPGNIVRIKVQSKNTLAGFLKKLFYKGEEYYIDYELEDGNILTYRYVPSTAVDGLWCNPFMRFPTGNMAEPGAVRCKLRNSNPGSVSKEVEVRFETLVLNDRGSLDFLFGKNTDDKETVLKTSFTDFEDIIPENDSWILTDQTALSGIRANQVNPGSFSYTYVLDLDSLWNMDTTINTLIIEANAAYLNDYGVAGLVISAEGTGQDFWDVRYLNNSLNKNSWHWSYLRRTLNKSKQMHGIVKIYLFNNGSKPLFTDDFKVTVKKTKSDNF